MLIAGIPIKPFGVAKARLAPVLDARARSRLGKAIAQHTAAAVAAAGATPVVVSGDDEVRAWAKRQSIDSLREIDGAGLDGAATALTRHATRLGARWAIVHADLPMVTRDDLEAVFAAGRRGAAIAPSHDGGTNVLCATAVDFPFAYGAASFHRHLAVIPSALVVSRPGLAHDLDTPADLAAIAGHRAGAWLRSLLVASGALVP